MAKNFYKRTGEVFAKLGTSPSAWKPCNVADWIFDGETEYPVWSLPKGYKVAPTEHAIVEQQLFDRWASNAMNMTKPFSSHKCHLCGHLIVNVYYIQHDEKQLIMKVGSECVENYHLADMCRDTLKEHFKVVKKNFKAQYIEEKYHDLENRLTVAASGHKKSGKWMPRWLWEANKKLDKNYVKTIRQASNFIKKYEPLLDEAILNWQLKAAGLV
jgi:hypothetical protein